MKFRHPRRALGWTGLTGAMIIAGCSQIGSSVEEEDAEDVATVAQGLTVTSGVYEIRNVNSDKCLDVDDWSTLDGANLQQWTCNAANQANQRFIVTDLGNGEYSIVNEHSGKSLDVDPDPCAVELFGNIDFGGASQCYANGHHGTLTPNDDASSIKIKAGHRARLYSDINAAGTVLDLHTTASTTDFEDATLVDNSFNDMASSLRVMSNVRQWSQNLDQNGNPVPAGAHQRFKIEDYTGTGEYRIKPVSATALCVNVDASGMADGANIHAYSCGTTASHRFKFTAISGGTTTVGSPTLNDGFGYADAAALMASGKYEIRDDTSAGESACRFGGWGVGVEPPSAANGQRNVLWLRTDNAQIPGDDDYLGDRPCKSGELRTAQTYGPYGDIEVTMFAQASAASVPTPGGRTGFVLGVYTGEVTPAAPFVTNRRLGLELTGLRLNHVEALLIGNNDPQCTTFHECEGNRVASAAPGNGFSAVAWDALGAPIFHTYKIEWRWHSIKYYVDGALVNTFRRPTRYGTTTWPDSATKLFLSFFVPNHEMENSYGGPWIETDIEEEIDWHEAMVDTLKFKPCSGEGCVLP
jgi:hypothetical protein